MHRPMVLSIFVAYIFLPPIFFAIYLPNKLTLTAAHTCISEAIAILGLCRLARRRNAWGESLMLLVAFASVLIADSIYYFSFPGTGRHVSMTVIYLRDLLFAIFSLSLATQIIPAAAAVIRDYLSLALSSATLTFLASINFQYVIIPRIQSLPGLQALQIVTTVVYTAAEVAMMGMMVPLMLRTTSIPTALFLQTIFFLGIGDFGIRAFAQPALGNPFLIGYEYAWELSMAALAMLILATKELPLIKRGRVATYYSLRVILSLSICLGMGIFFMLFGTIFRSFSESLDLANVLLTATAVFITANILSLIAMDLFFGQLFILIKANPEGRDDADGYFQEIPQIRHLFEISILVEAYNELSRRAERLYTKASEASRLAAIARTTQMLAHDVRKPFSMVSSILTSLQESKSFSESQALVQISSGEVHSALAAVSGMLEDVMEVGNDAPLQAEDASLTVILERSLREICRVYMRCNIDILPTINHRRMLHVDALKVQRLVSNIFANAIQAMNFSGKIWIKSSDEGPIIRCTIGNDGSMIAKEDLSHLFDAFFTKNKRGGTGLGLAIAKKIVDDHGGEIWATSSKQIGVEFHFCLPASDAADTQMITLPSSTKAVYDSFRSAEISVRTEDVNEQHLSADLEAEIVTLLGSRRLRILLLDNEALYRNALVALISTNSRLQQHFEISLAATSQEALNASVMGMDIGIFDFDLGPESRDGIETLRLLRLALPSIKVCLHSNRMTTTHTKLALDAGAVTFLPKPINRVHLLRFIRDCLGEIPQYAQGVALLDDSLLFLRAWERRLRGRPFYTFNSPEEFWDYARNHPAWLKSLSCVITDNHFGAESLSTGIDLAEQITDIPVILATGTDFRGKDLPRGIFRVIGKEVLDWDEIQVLIKDFPTL